MKAWLLLAGGLGVGWALIAWLQRVVERDHVSTDWQVQHERRAWREGVDQRCVDWPIQKLRNEASSFNTHRLRRKA